VRVGIAGPWVHTPYRVLAGETLPRALSVKLHAAHVGSTVFPALVRGGQLGRRSRLQRVRIFDGVQTLSRRRNAAGALLRRGCRRRLKTRP
jgi:hypothetical protein